MSRPLRTEEDDADDAREFLAARDGLGHLRVRRRADLLTRLFRVSGGFG